VLEIFFILISILLILLSALLYKVVIGKSVFNLNMISSSFWILGTLCFIPSLLLLINLPIVGKFSDEKMVYGDFNNKLIGWAIQYWVLIGIPIGCLIAKFMMPFRPINSEKISINAIKNIEIGKGFTEGSLFKTSLIFFLLFSSIYFISTGTNNPFFITISGGNLAEILVARNEYLPAKGMNLFDLFIRTDTLIIFSSIAFSMYLKTKKKKWSYLFFFMSLTVMLTFLFSGTTGPILFYIIFLVYVRYKYTGKFLNTWQLSTVFFILFFSFAYFKTSEDSVNKGEIIAHIFNRTFFDQSKGLYFALQIFPDSHPFLMFSSSALWLNNLIGAPTSPDYGFVLMSYFYPEGVESGVAGHFTSIFITEMWANFGWFGIVLCPLWAGFVIYSVDYWFRKKKLTIINIAFIAHISIFGFGYFSDFVRFYYPVNVSFTYLGVLIVLILGQFISKNTKKLKVSTTRVKY
jgi:hypothetical protein